MKCCECGGNLEDRWGGLELPSQVLGSFELIEVNYLKCDQCGEVILPEVTWRLADRQEGRIVQGILQNMPVSEFVGAAGAAEILGISRQALHKHRRIRNGFVYSISHEGKPLYHRESLLLFQEVGDGRFPLRSSGRHRTIYLYCVALPQSRHRAEREFRQVESKTKGAGWGPWDTSQLKPSGYLHA